MIVKSAFRSPRAIVGYSFEEYKEMVRQFHGSEAPGLLIGGLMVALALKHLPPDSLYDSICEERTCLPDAIQLLTPCTVGNGWLKMVPFGRYALTLYNKTNEDHEGVRTFLNPRKMIDWPEIHAWFLKLINSTEQLGHGLSEQIQDAGSDILGVQSVKIADQFFVKEHKGKIAVCPQCGETHPVQDGKICLACQGNEVYL